ncbi:alpha/beta hydrolase [Roseospira marina]|uniref:Alpha/beta hydrolase n=1 Tax=Roseospira marina TaxID=140057 RepID=A0A5M6IE38_9PROT|nr:alpha/beta fold hydrolase [Roseospira marina]KAA5605848.1 alpha/beta hydrolase [Roseospira marina]MBB4313667.1 polyhydroxyalkanoate synthase [Roseospira marina]MBB5086829.1 polyhydroxyalkanoate synthase [Roseospira marina]
MTIPPPRPPPEAPPKAPAPRQGPRPLSVHLTTQTLQTMSWPLGLSAWNGASPFLRPFWSSGSAGADPPETPPPETPDSETNPKASAEPDTRAALAAVLEQARAAGIDPAAFAAAVDAEARRRFGAFLDGVAAYRGHAEGRADLDGSVVWARGSTTLHAFASMPEDSARRARAQVGPPILLVPSLVNRGTILNLTRRRGFAPYLAWRGLRPFLVEWGRPGAAERGFAIADYVVDRLEAAFDHVVAVTGRRPLVLGYCMGGLLALALAVRRPADVAGLVLLATPWDFHAAGEPARQGRLARAYAPWVESVLATQDTLPVDVLQAAFAMIDPPGLARKFQTFGRLRPRGAAARHFVAVEDWLNDGVPLAAAVARETLAGWYADNAPGRGQWQVAGQPIQPESMTRPAYVVVPARDRIVPAASARALGQALPNATLREPPLGHIGMIVSRQAVARVHDPLVRWALRIGRATT